MKGIEFSVKNSVLNTDPFRDKSAKLLASFQSFQTSKIRVFHSEAG